MFQEGTAGAETPSMRGRGRLGESAGCCGSQNYTAARGGGAGLETGTDSVSRAFIPWLTCAPDTTLAKHILTHGIVPLSRLRPLPAEFTR